MSGKIVGKPKFDERYAIPREAGRLIWIDLSLWVVMSEGEVGLAKQRMADSFQTPPWQSFLLV